MNIQDYRESKLKTKVTADIAERWQKRVVVRGLDKQGRAGGLAYLESYGKRIGAKKCIRLAVMAESVSALEFAEIIWEKAYHLETGNTGSLSVNESDVSIVSIPTPETLPTVDGLPAHLQPGKIATLQPQNLKEDLSYYIQSSEFVAQPKRDGHRMLAICTANDVWYQKRSLKLDGPPSPEIHDALSKLAQDDDIIILDGELYWEDCRHNEHRTSAQAATSSINLGEPSFIPVARYALFDCLHYGQTDLTTRMFMGRVSYADDASCEMMCPSIYLVSLSLTATDKQELVRVQQGAHREGVVFRKLHSTYIAGKSKTAYRHKFLMEHVLTVTSLTPTTADGRLFGAMETELGLVGTGFSDADQVALWEIFHRDTLVIEVVSQGLTENGRLWHPRYVKVVS